jgi:sugar phosphate isomerase/epimerase
MNRRNSLKILGTAGLGLPFRQASSFFRKQKLELQSDGGIHIFSKHLQWLDYEKMAIAAKEMGFDGVDLTVRPKGHVLPENVERDLPKAVEAVRKVGLKAELITTAITNAEDEYTEKIIKTASQLGIKYYRLGWLKYKDDQPIPLQLELYKKQLKALEQMNQNYNIHGAYQNHSGDGVGSAVWDIWLLIKDLNPDYLGCRFDVRHAMAEGLKSWKLGLKLLQTHIKTFDLKDFIYAKTDNGWGIENVPIGQGAVDFEDYFKTIGELKINAPYTLHAEYDLGGANKGKSQITLPSQTVLNALKMDLNTLKTVNNKN